MTTPATFDWQAQARQTARLLFATAVGIPPSEASDTMADAYLDFSASAYCAP